MNCGLNAARRHPNGSQGATKRRRLVAAAIGGCLAFSGVADAGTATGNLTVQVTVTASCTVAATTLNFGTVAGTSLSSVLQATGSVSVTCTGLSPYAIGMGQGLNFSGGSNRMVSGGTNFLSYGLFTDAAFSHAWTTAASSSTCTSALSCVTGIGTGLAIATNIYGQIPITSPAPVAGGYADTVVMTITY